jgi:hypothetical protein
MYFVCDFNRRWVKDLSFLSCISILLKVEGRFLCCIGILLRVEGRIVGNIQLRCFFEIIFLQFF